MLPALNAFVISSILYDSSDSPGIYIKSANANIL